MRRVLAVVLGILGVAQADAALVTRDFSLTASSFVNFSGVASPITSLSATFRLTYDDSVSGFQGAPASFSTVTNGVANVGSFAAAPVFGYFPANDFSLFPRLGVGGAINGGNVILNGTDDFYFTFDASAVGPTSAMLSFTSADQATPFLATNAVVTPLAASPVPEPSAWAMLIGGFALVGGVMRGRTREIRSA